MRRVHDPQGTRLPIKLEATTDGEFAPVPLEPMHHAAHHLAQEAATLNARRLGLTRRAFMVSACGAASALAAMNAAYARGGRTGGHYELQTEAGLDMHAARSALDRREFIFDVQGHFVNPTGAWTKRLPPGAQPLIGLARQNRGCTAAEQPGPGYLKCLDADAFIKDVFLDSDTEPDPTFLTHGPRTLTQWRRPKALGRLKVIGARSSRPGSPSPTWPSRAPCAAPALPACPARPRSRWARTCPAAPCSGPPRWPPR